MKTKLPRECAPQAGPSDVPPKQRFAIAFAAGLAAWTLAFLKLRVGGAYLYALDFTPHWRAADAIIRGYNPYDVINAFTTMYPFSAGYLYMLPTAIFVLPFGYLAPQTAMPLFAGITVAVFAYALMRDGYWRLPLLASAPLIYSARTGQTAPLIVAAMLMPSFGWLAPMKYTLGVAGWCYNLSRRYALLAIGVIAVSIGIWPWWPQRWYHELSDVAGVYYHIPIRVSLGFAVLLAIIRWRRPESRLLVTMAFLPQTMLFYDQLPLGLVARSYRQTLVMAVLSYLPLLVLPIVHGTTQTVSREGLLAWAARIIVACYYLPCLVVVLARPNVGAVPPWLESLATRFPAWLRGTTA